MSYSLKHTTPHANPQNIPACESKKEAPSPAPPPRYTGNMPLKHTEPQQNPQHSTETAESGYAVTHTRGSSENSDLPADAISASSRVQSYLRDNRGWMNIIVVAHMQFFCCVLSVAFINGYGWIPLISALCSTTALYFRYRFPYGSIYVVIAALCLTLLSPFPDSLAVTCYPPVTLAAYHIGRHWTRRARFRGLILGWVGALAVTVQASLSFLYHWDDIPARIFISLMLGVLCGSIFTVFWFLGDSRRMRELRSEEFEERARRLEYEQEQERRLAAQDERTRIAREMHDIVAHSLSSIISQADGARYAAASARTARAQQAEQSGQAQQQSEPDIAEQTLKLIADTARDSLTQMRSLLGLLRTDEATTYAPVPTLSDVPALVEQSRRAGLPVTFTGITGTMARTLPQGAELAAYRTVQEALTNALKHSPGAATTVTIHWSDEVLQLRVENEPVSSATAQHIARPVPGSGNGLRGMSERIALYHGTLTYGLQPDGGWLVEAALPYSDL
ncbi:signal transduction histidine kinase [Rothia mucilaginosa DY-18]|uniref:histidine kinase n=2 Tax=Rothia mucilaginosa TaxID=43675 RepID=D2NSG7_ROTMD|nr:signal transduction histidine kinase [Rothia mucilaginosa DY-18]